MALIVLRGVSDAGIASDSVTAAAGAARDVVGFPGDAGLVVFFLPDLAGAAGFDVVFCAVCFLAACSGELAIRASRAETVTNSRRFKKLSGMFWIHPAPGRGTGY